MMTTNYVNSVDLTSEK